MKLRFLAFITSIFCWSFVLAAPRKPIFLNNSCSRFNQDLEHLFQRNVQQSDLNPYPSKPKVSFRPDGTFKLTIFSDLHFGENPWDDWGPEQDANSTRLMNTVLHDERPDYVTNSVLNGDLITGESTRETSLSDALVGLNFKLDTFRENSTKLIDEIVAPLNAVKVPFSSTHGNHDNQANISHVEEILREQKVAPLSYTRMAPSGVGGAGGPGNYWVPVYRKKTDLAPVLVLWFFDSRGGFSLGANSTRLPDWVDTSVAAWIESESRIMNDAWGPADKRGALAFVHIPPHIATDLQNELDSDVEPGLNADSLDGGGSVQATTVSTDFGKDDVFWDAVNANIKNLHAVFSGHDHGDEWCARDTTKDVIFCFGKHSGFVLDSDLNW
ncbi:hypothetical protein H0H93_006076 [Arthromyces matolae]|nr:hypothetical protein H0H93_006076 [Arthromyces matolae]